MFITNSGANKLEKRLNELIGFSEELKFLVGFFYFSGIKELLPALKENPFVTLKILVGLDTDALASNMVVEIARNDRSAEQIIDRYFKSIEKGLRQDDFDTKEYYEQIAYYIELINAERLHIRRTFDPNHAKLYYFKTKEEYRGLAKDKFITGSSNLTKAGLTGQHEFNIEIGDFGTAEAEKYFDDLWERGVPITEQEPIRKRLIDLIEMNTLVAKLTPFEAYLLILKTYRDTFIDIDKKMPCSELLKKRGYQEFSYQTDAVAQALTTIQNYGGVIIADVVGLGKSIIAGLAARFLNKRGLIICPPGLIGDDNKTVGWQKYREDFDLHDWEVRSLGDLEKTAEYIAESPDYDVVVVDEAHRFRNQNTRDYELLRNICRGRIVILLTATPFNNSPADIFSLLKLFIIPGKSRITLDDDLEARFRNYDYLYTRLSYIVKNRNSKDAQKRKKAELEYEKLFDGKKPPIDLKEVQQRTRTLSSSIKEVIGPVVIRRNRLDIKNDPVYSKEIGALSETLPPQELFFALTPDQSRFYDTVISEYFGEEGLFHGAIYTPYLYNREKPEEEEEEKKTLEGESQKNLKDFMRRLAVKRFESSFAAFRQTIRNFIAINTLVLDFIKKSKGRYILDRRWMEKIYELDGDEMEDALLRFSEEMTEKGKKVKGKIYETDKFDRRVEFFAHIDSDLALFKKIVKEIDELNLVAEDPKVAALIAHLPRIRKDRKTGDPERKVVIFTEYLDTLKYLGEKLTAALPGEVLVMPKDLREAGVREILENFDASSKKKANDHQILAATDKMAEGFNLARAGAIVNYDIPWNPTRVIQRVGRINRIGQKMFKELHIYNFFPTEQGAEIVKSREIAAQKMFMIHNALGEDSRIFDPDEEVKPSSLFVKINRNPEEGEEENFATFVRRTYFELAEKYPDTVKRIEQFSPRVKTAKEHDENSLLVFTRKGRAFFVRGIRKDDEVDEMSLTEVIPLIACEPETPTKELGPDFWRHYDLIRAHETKHRSATTNSIIIKASNNLASLLGSLPPELEPYRPFITTLHRDMAEFKTLSEYTLRKIAELPMDKPEKRRKVLEELAKELGEKYLDGVEKAVREFESEIIIAVENRKSPKDNT